MAFISAEWKDLVLINFQIDPARLEGLVPFGVELDFHEDQAFISLVAFRFLNTRVWGIGWPWHKNFEEVNLLHKTLVTGKGS